MNKNLILVLMISLLCCSKEKKLNIQSYHDYTNKAEIAICNQDYIKALNFYKIAFEEIDKPFGVDLYNAALLSAIIGEEAKKNLYLQKIVNNTGNLEFVESIFVDKYISIDKWNYFLDNKEIAYNIQLRREFDEIKDKDQLMRPLYDQYEDSIEANRIQNLLRIIELADVNGLPAHQELGYNRSLRGQDYHIVFHHTAQMRSRNKSILDLEPLIRDAVHTGRLDPEVAVFYMSLQNDREKGRYETFSTWQYHHPLLPDTLKNKTWVPYFNKEYRREIDSIRKSWYADSLEEIELKASFLSNTSVPFVFTSVTKSISNLRNDLKIEEVLEQYQLFTNEKKEL